MFPVTFMNRFVAKTLACIVLLMVAQTSADVTVTTFAGSGIPGFVNGNGTDAQFNNPRGLAFGQDGNLYVADGSNSAIRVITKDGNVSTYANFKTLMLNPQPLFFINPTGIAFDTSGKLYVADSQNHAIWALAAHGESANLVAGNGTQGWADGQGITAMFNKPAQIAFARAGNLIVADAGNNLLRVVDANGMVSTVAGDGRNTSVEGVGKAASFSVPLGVAVDKNGLVYISELGGQYIRRIASDGKATFYAGNGVVGNSDGVGVQASFRNPSYLAFDQNDNLYVADSSNYVVRMIDPIGNVTTIAGNGFNSSVDGNGTTASINGPAGLAFGSGGTLYVADVIGSKIRKITLATSTDTSTNTTTTIPVIPTPAVDPPPREAPVGMIIGVVAAVLVVVGAIGIGVFVHIRNRKPKEPFIPPPPPAPYDPDYIPDGKPVI